MTTHETRGVLAGAYTAAQWKKMQRGELQLLTHTVEVNEEGADLRVLCERVALDSMSDVGGTNQQGALDVTIRPTCPTCARRDPRWLANGDDA